jgi:acyl dehydratase
MRLVYFEDLRVGDVYWGREVVVDPDEMMAYNLKNDPWPFHVDQEASKRSPFGGIIASGGYTITLMYRSLLGIYNNADTRWEFLGGFDWKLKFVTPVRPGDRLRVKMTIKSARPSSKEGRGVVNNFNEVLNQNGETVLSLDVVFLLAARPVSDSGRQIVEGA